MALLSLPQTDGPEDEELPKGAERSEKFVDVANEYFERLDVSRDPFSPPVRYVCNHLSAGHPHRHPVLPCAHQAISYRSVRDQRAASWVRPACARCRAALRGRARSRARHSRFTGGASGEGCMEGYCGRVDSNQGGEREGESRFDGVLTHMAIRFHPHGSLVYRYSDFYRSFPQSQQASPGLPPTFRC